MVKMNREDFKFAWDKIRRKVKKIAVRYGFIYADRYEFTVYDCVALFGNNFYIGCLNFGEIEDIG